MTHDEFMALDAKLVTLEETRRQVAAALRGRPGFRDMLEAAILGYVHDGTYDRCMAAQEKWVAAGRPSS